MPEPYDLYAVHYGTHPNRSPHENVAFAGPDDTGGDLYFYVWAAVGRERTFVIDTGMSARAAAAHKRTYLRTPAEGLARVGVDAAAVGDVIVTHMHWDHGGTLGEFPAARFHIQDAEVSYCTGRHMHQRPLRIPYYVGDVEQLVRHLYQDRVAFHDGDAELAPGISVHLVGGHSRGLQVARVWTRRGWVVLASDASHFYANMEQRKLFPLVVDACRMVAGWDICFRLASSPQHVIPGHDPLVMARYPAPSPSLEGIAVRLDVAPRGERG